MDARRWASGDQELPSRLVLASPEEMAQVLGHDKSWSRAGERYAAWCTQFPLLAGSRAVARNCDDVFIGYSDADFVRLTTLLQWLVDYPNSNLYLRQLPVADVDTKWVWPRRGIVRDLMRQLRFPRALRSARGTGTASDACPMPAPPREGWRALRHGGPHRGVGQPTARAKYQPCCGKSEHGNRTAGHRRRRRLRGLGPRRWSTQRHRLVA